MKIKVNVSNFFNEDKIFRRVGHIKAIREQLKYNIKEAKDISDIVNDAVGKGFSTNYLVIETTQYPQLDFMLHDDRVKYYVNKPGDVITFLERDVVDTPEVKLLKATTNKLIKIGAYESAKLILDILYDLHEASEDA
jgi:hypothetical protein